MRTRAWEYAKCISPTSRRDPPPTHVQTETTVRIPKKSKKDRGCKFVIEDKGFGIACKMTKQEKKRLHNQSQGVLMRTLIKAVGKREIRACLDKGKTRDRARHYWSRLNPGQKNEVLLKASKDVPRGSQDEIAIKSLADGTDMVGKKYRCPPRQ